MSTSKHRFCSDKGLFINPAEVTTCNESENSGNFKNIKSVNKNNHEPTTFSKKLPEKKTCKAQIITNANNSMEKSFLIRKKIYVTKSYLNSIIKLSWLLS